MLIHRLWGKIPAADEEMREQLRQQGILDDSYTVQPLDMIRRTMARRMTQSFTNIPHFSLRNKIGVDALLSARTAYNDRHPDQRVSFNDAIVKAVATAIAQCPAVNVSYHDKGILMHHHVDVAVAVAIDGGLITPIVRAAETKSIAEISAEIKDMAGRARHKRLMPEEYIGGTFTISNLGMHGVSEFTSIINPPQACILSVGSISEELQLIDGQIVMRNSITPTLNCDHRAIDGATGASWLQAFQQVIETPEPWLHAN